MSESWQDGGGGSCLKGNARRIDVMRTSPGSLRSAAVVAAFLGAVAFTRDPAVAAPIWKTAPATPSPEADEGLPVLLEVEGPLGEALEAALVFIGTYYGYIAVTAVVCLLVLLSLIGRDRSDAAVDGACAPPTGPAGALRGRSVRR